MSSVADVMVQMIRNEQVDVMFGLPGGENVEFIEAARQAGLDLVTTKREGSSAFMASMYGQLTGRPGICLATLGPGSTSLVNGVADGLLDRVPMLALTAQVSTPRRETWTHQNLDQNALFRPITKWTTGISPHSAARTMRKAIRTALAQRPGPVHIDIPGDVPRLESREAALPPFRISQVQAFAQAYTSGGPGIEAAVTALAHSRRPVIVTGYSAALNRAEHALLRFAEAWSIPIITTPRAKGVAPEQHPLFVGVIDMAAPELVATFLEQADLIIAAGFDAVELIKDWTYSAPVIHIDTLPNTDQVYGAQIELIGDLSLILNALAQPATATQAKWDEGELRAHRRKLYDRLTAARPAYGLAPHEVVLTCQQAFSDDDTILTLDVGSHKVLTSQLWQSRRPRSLFQSNGLSSMGFGFPAALAAKLVEPDRPVLCLTGDGGFSMVISELEVAVERALHVVTVVFSDGSLNLIEKRQIALGYPSVGTRTQRHHFARVAEAYGALGLVASTRAELERALVAARAANGPVVIEAHVDPSPYQNLF